MKLKGLNSIACVFAVLAVQASAQAGQISFTESTCQSGSATASAVTCSTSSAGTNYSATLTGWSTANTGKFSSASIGYYAGSGLGISAGGESTNGSQHAVDNYLGTDAFLINFGSSSFALDMLSIGWRSGDSDVSILRYTGTDAPVLANRTVADLKNAAGWEWVGDFANLSTTSDLSFNNSGTIKTASWWLVSAYNSSYSGIAPANGLSNGDDYFKVDGFGGSIVKPVTPPPTPGNAVPEPGSFALIGIALAGLAAVRRRKA